jgi:hypothetical protein
VCTSVLDQKKKKKKNSEKFGGTGKTVKIDESTFEKRKFHKDGKVDGV